MSSECRCLWWSRPSCSRSDFQAICAISFLDQDRHNSLPSGLSSSWRLSGIQSGVSPVRRRKNATCFHKSPGRSCDTRPVEVAVCDRSTRITEIEESIIRAMSCPAMLNIPRAQYEPMTDIHTNKIHRVFNSPSLAVYRQVPTGSLEVR
ncbi:hypothetical protein AAG570_006394 [Ranatra chinensis]|uniref:Uncharacterized protein n=1 Tax=Ranatra chinensis TaxID=642074 RepID=A0ABD0YTV6_9HEMI